MKHYDWGEQYDLWEDFRKKLLFENRFLKQHEVLNKVTSIVNSSILNLPQGAVLYRARTYSGDLNFIQEYKEVINKTLHPEEYIEENKDENGILYENLRKIIMEAERRKKRGLEERTQSGFWGYDENDSFIPQNVDLIKDGRANPAKIRYLYAADNPNTALAEVRPLIESYISIAEIEVLTELKIADLSYDIYSKASKDDEMLIYLIMEDFSKPNNNDFFDYIPTQYISEHIKSLGYDGLKYNSSLYKRGRNYVIFNHHKCKAISSKLYQLDDICYDAKCVGPVGLLLGENDLFHWKLQQFKETWKKNLLEKLRPKNGNVGS